MQRGSKWIAMYSLDSHVYSGVKIYMPPMEVLHENYIHDYNQQTPLRLVYEIYYTLSYTAYWKFSVLSFTCSNRKQKEALWDSMHLMYIHACVTFNFLLLLLTFYCLLFNYTNTHFTFYFYFSLEAVEIETRKALLLFWA